MSFYDSEPDNRDDDIPDDEGWIVICNFCESRDGEEHEDECPFSDVGRLLPAEPSRRTA